MRQYLLNQAREEDRVPLEDAYFADDELFEELEAAETDLVDDYVRGRLAGADRAAFEVRCQASPRLRERVSFARQLADRSIPAQPAAPWWVRAWESVRFHPVLVPGMAAAVLVLAAAVGWWAWHPSSATAPREAQQARTDPAAQPAPGAGGSGKTATPAPGAIPGPASVQPPPGRLLALVLVPGLMRSAGDVATLAIGADDRTVEMSLEHEGPVRSAYRAAIRTPEGKTAWEQTGLRPAGPAKPLVVATVPVSALPAGDYIVTLTSADAGRPAAVVAEYAFLVVRR